jgi:hypothetical protein
MQMGSLEHEKSLPLDLARSRLTGTWFVGAAILTLIVVVQSLMGRYGSRTQEAWEWLLPTIMPTSGMILSGLLPTALSSRSSRVSVRRLFYRVTVCLACFYQLAILLTILLQPFSNTEISEAIDNMHRSNLWLGPIQGLVGLALGVLFVSKRQDDRQGRD